MTRNHGGNSLAVNRTADCQSIVREELPNVDNDDQRLAATKVAVMLSCFGPYARVLITFQSILCKTKYREATAPPTGHCTAVIVDRISVDTIEAGRDNAELPMAVSATNEWNRGKVQNRTGCKQHDRTVFMFS